MYRSRHNPFSACEEALGELLKVIEPDLSVQKRIAEDHILSQMGGHWYWDDDELERINQLLQEAQSLEGMRAVLETHARPSMSGIAAYSIWPAYFLMQTPEVLEDVEFIHWARAADKISKEGFRGRLTPSKMTATPVLPDFEELNNGYIFAYQADKLYEDTVVGGPKDEGSEVIKGFATYALRFNFIPDRNEEQLIIPVKCIRNFKHITSDEIYDLSAFY